MRCAAGRVCFSNAARLVPVRVCREDFACTTVLRWIGRGTEVGTIVLRHRRWPSGWMLFACDTPSPTRPRPRPGYEHGDRNCYARHAHPPGEAQTARGGGLGGYKARKDWSKQVFSTHVFGSAPPAAASFHCPASLPAPWIVIRLRPSSRDSESSAMGSSRFCRSAILDRRGLNLNCC